MDIKQSYSLLSVTDRPGAQRGDRACRGRNTLSAFGELEVDCLLFRWKCVWYLFEVHNPITWAQIHFLCMRQLSDWLCYWKRKIPNSVGTLFGWRFAQLKHFSKNIHNKKLFLSSHIWSCHVNSNLKMWFTLLLEMQYTISENIDV